MAIAPLMRATNSLSLLQQPFSWSSSLTSPFLGAIPSYDGDLNVSSFPTIDSFASDVSDSIIKLRQVSFPSSNNFLLHGSNVSEAGVSENLTFPMSEVSDNVLFGLNVHADVGSLLPLSSFFFIFAITYSTFKNALKMFGRHLLFERHTRQIAALRGRIEKLRNQNYPLASRPLLRKHLEQYETLLKHMKIDHTRSKGIYSQLRQSFFYRFMLGVFNTPYFLMNPYQYLYRSDWEKAQSTDLADLEEMRNIIVFYEDFLHQVKKELEHSF